MINEAGYTILNNLNEDFCTRETHTTKSIIDHVLTNLQGVNFHMALLDTPLSDHKQIYLDIKQIKVDKKRETHEYLATDYTALYKSMETTVIQNKDYDYEILENLIKTKIQGNKCTKIKILNKPREDWINKEVLNSLRDRNIAWNQHRADVKNTERETTFKTKRYEAFKTTRNAKINFYSNAFEKCNKRPRKMWDLINSLVNNKNKINIIPPNLVRDSNIIVNNPYEICQLFNDFFSTVGSDLASKIPQSYHRNFHPFTSLSHSQNNTIHSFAPTTKKEVGEIIDKLNVNTSKGIDDIGVKDIKCIKYFILDNLTDCFNKCLTQGKFPESLKIAKVTPVYKSGSKTDPGNYRPISVLPVLSKILEKLIYVRLYNYLNKQNFFFSQQYGFRPKSNTLSATVDIVTKIKNALDSKQIVLGIFIDLKKAFDTVSHNLLLQKLHKEGITGSAIKILESYLHRRKQIVKIGKFQSKPATLTYGVPQGSILGPLLFLIYINSISNIDLSGDITLYADDTSLFYFGDNIKNIIDVAQRDLNVISEWFVSNLLTINTKKTSYMIFAPKNKNIPNHDQLTIFNEPINKTDHEKYLGLIMDSKLTWQYHIDHLKNKISPLIGALRKISLCIPNKIRPIIYNSLVKPHIEYLIEIWGTAAKSNIKSLQTLQNKIIKVLYKYDYMTPSVELYKKTKFLNINQLYTLKTCMLIRKIITNKTHSQLHFHKKTHTYHTRKRNKLELPKTRTNYGKKNILFEGVQIYNKLSDLIINSKSFPIFKKRVIEYVQNNL